MKGAEAIIKTMIDSDVRVCFGNPGTSEMHFVAAPHRPRRRTPQRGEPRQLGSLSGQLRRT
jgi:acetolactate synthase-1/2/3 large subunit